MNPVCQSHSLATIPSCQSHFISASTRFPFPCPARQLGIQITGITPFFLIQEEEDSSSSSFFFVA